MKTHSVDAISREEQNTLIVLQQPQEDRNECIPVHIRERPLLQEYVRLINEQHGLPCMRQIQDPRQLAFQVRCRSTKIARRNDIQRAPGVLGDALRRERLAHPRRTVQHRDEPSPLAFDDIVELAVLDP